MVKKLIDISEKVYAEAKSKAAIMRMSLKNYVQKAIEEKNGI
jgi:hypothetical protein